MQGNVKKEKSVKNTELAPVKSVVYDRMMVEEKNK